MGGAMAVVSKLEARQNRRAAAARIATNLGNHSFMPPRARRNSRPRREELGLDEVERIRV